MKKIISTLCLASLTIAAIAQCEGGRYKNELFPGFYDGPLPSLPSAVVYGSNVDNTGNNQSLDMYVFQPQNDTATKRPLVILAFGGSFITGAKESPDILKLCNAYVKRGYVAVSIKYRIGANPIDSINMMKAVLRGVQDMKACIRFFKKDAYTDNEYRIDTNNIFVGGVSAGAFVGIHTAYLDKISELQPWIQDSAVVLGGLDGNSGNPGYTTTVKGVVNLCGAIGDTTWMEPGNPSIISMHGTDDGTVPYDTRIINVQGVDIIYVNGSRDLDVRAENIGLRHQLYTWYGADHTPFVNMFIPGSTGAKYMDSTINATVDYLFNEVCGVVGVDDRKKEELVRVFPNPAETTLNIIAPYNGFAVQIIDQTGRSVANYQTSSTRLMIDRNQLTTGLYNLIIRGNDTSIVRRILFQ